MMNTMHCALSPCWGSRSTEAFPVATRATSPTEGHQMTSRDVRVIESERESQMVGEISLSYVHTKMSGEL